ncbi:HyaD/HybD family hydrogenase maturation endopeptidase [Paraburkholderia dinghuensis]|uniref:HyaD/HybD family hydrogenase maturation endopeptidase n=1 Tax=Paraburkholderia dinghuensis TaxID=2305225 RepID=UPI00162A5EF7|nr:HyaD/HybD family hydrogenase maturation endopeptidase [Paraburkholderia dinghuensis]
MNLNPIHEAQRTASPTRERIVVLGIGNTQWGDAGFGVRAVERLKADWQCAANVEAVVGGTQGRALLPLVESAGRLIVFNIADFGVAPGTLRLCVNDTALDHLHTRGVGVHQMDFADALACARLKGRAPRHLVLIGVQPLELDAYGADLDPVVRAKLDPAVEAACRQLRRWRAAPRRREAPMRGMRTAA